MPSFKVISKVGEVAGESIEIAARDGEFLSRMTYASEPR